MTAATRDLLLSEEVEIGRRPSCLLTRAFVRYCEGGEVGVVGKEAKKGDRLKRDRGVKLQSNGRRECSKRRV